MKSWWDEHEHAVIGWIALLYGTWLFVGYAPTWIKGVFWMIIGLVALGRYKTRRSEKRKQEKRERLTKTPF